MNGCFQLFLNEVLFEEIQMRLVVSTMISAVLFCAVGCGPGQVTVYSVKGKLTRGGQPLGDVHMDLSPTDAGDHTFASADVGPDGTFELKCSDGRMGAEAGSYKVVLSNKAGADPMEAMMAMRDKMQTSGESMDPDKSGADPNAKFPPEYSSEEKSPKTVEIKAAADQTLDIDI